MLQRDLPEVLAIEQATFPIPWTHESFLHEIERNPFACNRVIRSSQGAVVGYSSTWMVDGEVRINNIAIGEPFRGRGFGEALLRSILDLGRALGCVTATLEVRPSNSPAISLYTKLGFREVGLRKGYYTDTREDAIVMKAFL
jgi:[ribosomal protein S18]-alanine N-acetyltransferase